jgi:hypothetical protein
LHQAGVKRSVEDLRWQQYLRLQNRRYLLHQVRRCSAFSVHGLTGGLGALYPPRIIPGLDAACFAWTVKTIQQPLYDAAGSLVLPSELHKVFPVGAFVKVHFKIEAIKRTDAPTGCEFFGTSHGNGIVQQ